MSKIQFLKDNRLAYRVYKFVVGLFVNFVKVFVKTDNKLILFVSYGGRHYSDSPKTLYECMLTDDRFKSYKFIWAFKEPKDHPNINSVKIDSIRYFIVALKARCWITNVVVERGLDFRGKNTFYFHTTHVTLPKLMGADMPDGSFGKDFRYKYDCSCAQSEFEKQLQIKMFGLNKEKIIVSGYPKNDYLVNNNNNNDLKLQILKELGLPINKKIILYAPTYREESPDEMNCPVDFVKWERILSDEFIVLFRAHPVVRNMTKIPSNSSFVFDVSDYSDNVKIMLCSDILISDYSGIFFEYGVLNRPMYCFAYDYEQYTRKRGLYFDIRSELPGGYCSEEELLRKVANGLNENDQALLNEFSLKYISEKGNATARCLDVIYNNISEG